MDVPRIEGNTSCSFHLDASLKKVGEDYFSPFKVPGEAHLALSAANEVLIMLEAGLAHVLPALLQGTVSNRLCLAPASHSWINHTSRGTSPPAAGLKQESLGKKTTVTLG